MTNMKMINQVKHETCIVANLYSVLWFNYCGEKHCGFFMMDLPKHQGGRLELENHFCIFYTEMLVHGGAKGVHRLTEDQ